jgi:hypothetical protein
MTQHPASISTTVAAYPYIRYGMYTRGNLGSPAARHTVSRLSLFRDMSVGQKTSFSVIILPHTELGESYNKEGTQRLDGAELRVPEDKERPGYTG